MVASEAGPPAAEAGARPRGRRFASVDTLRGMVLALMIFVAPATGLSGGFSTLLHAEWNGLTVGDLVFPSFLVTSGLSLSFLLRAGFTSATWRRLAKRLALLVVFGLAYNAYGATWLDLSSLRFTGVLQMIGIAGACGAAVVYAGRALFGADRIGWLLAAASGVLVLYGWGLDAGSCEPTPRCSPYGAVDTALLGAGHVYRSGAAGYDPEGIVASLAATAFVLYGYAAGVVIARHGSASWRATVTRLAALAAGYGGAALVASMWLPVNKRLLTPSFVLVTAAIAVAALAAVFLAVDASGAAAARRGTQWTWPFVALGRNAILVYLFERFLYMTPKHVRVGDRTLEAWLIDSVLPFGEPGVHLAYSAVVLALILLVTGALHRRQAYWAL